MSAYAANISTGDGATQDLGEESPTCGRSQRAYSHQPFGRHRLPVPAPAGGGDAAQSSECVGAVLCTDGCEGRLSAQGAICETGTGAEAPSFTKKSQRLQAYYR